MELEGPLVDIKEVSLKIKDGNSRGGGFNQLGEEGVGVPCLWILGHIFTGPSNTSFHKLKEGLSNKNILQNKYKKYAPISVRFLQPEISSPAVGLQDLLFFLSSLVGKGAVLWQ